MDSSRAVVMKSVSKIVTPPTSGLIRREEALHFLGLSGDEDDAVEPLRVYPRARPKQTLNSLICGTEENYQDFCTEVENYNRAKTRECAHGVTAREGRVCKREYKAIARRQPAIERGGLLGLHRCRQTAKRRLATEALSTEALSTEALSTEALATVANVDPPHVTLWCGGSTLPVAQAVTCCAMHVTDTGGSEGRMPSAPLLLARSTERALEVAEADRREALNAARKARKREADDETDRSSRDFNAFRVARHAARVHTKHLEGLEGLEQPDTTLIRLLLLGDR